MTTPLDDFTTEELDQFKYLIGCYLFQSPVACLFARHAKPLSTIRDYFDIEEGRVDKVTAAARRFLVEFARVSNREDTKALADRWHGSNAVASSGRGNEKEKTP